LLSTLFVLVVIALLLPAVFNYAAHVAKHDRELRVTDEELSALYDVADLFVCASEHEGFCVPLIESFHKRVPVLAYASPAVPATMDGGGVLYTDKDPAHVAAIVDAVVSDPDLEAQIVEAQDAALARLQARDFGGLVCGFVEQVRGMPAQPAPPVAFDFWDRFASTQQLEELHQYRPAAYSALPRRLAAIQDKTGPAAP